MKNTETKYELKFMLDYGCNCLWSDNEKTRDKFGYQVDLSDVGILWSTIELSELVDDLHNLRLNPIYQNLPSFWSGEMHLYFQKKVIKLYNKIKKELDRDMFILNVSESAKREMECKIDVELINRKLNIFVSNPIKYFSENNINFDPKTINFTLLRVKCLNQSLGYLIKFGA